MVFIILILMLCCTTAFSTTYQVGADKQYTKPSQVASLVQDGDIVEINAGIYSADVAVWRANNLTLIGVGGGFAHLRADGAYAEGKAIWVIKGNNTSVENIEFSGCTVPDKNGAGIRQEGANLKVRKCYFHDNENGILTGKNLNSKILIEQSEFAYNGYGDGYSHNMYIGNIKKFDLRFCYSHHAKVGHCVKSRAVENHIEYNRIMDEWDGTSSMLIDLPNGGVSFIIGNVMMQGVETENRKLITYGKEGLSNPDNRIFIVNNTLVNYRSQCDFIDIDTNALTSYILNNLFAGPGNLIIGKNLDSSYNLHFDNVNEADFVEPDSLDYHIKGSSAAVDIGRFPGDWNNYRISVYAEYVHPCSYRDRDFESFPEIGAFEYHKPISVEYSNEDKLDLNVSPNPFNNNCLIEAKEGAEIKIYDLLGNIVFHDFFESDYIIWAPDKKIISGLYFVEISHDGKIKHKPVIIQ